MFIIKTYCNIKEHTTVDIFNASICNQKMNVYTNVNDIILFIPVASSSVSLMI